VHFFGNERPWTEGNLSVRKIFPAISVQNSSFHHGGISGIPSSCRCRFSIAVRSVPSCTDCTYTDSTYTDCTYTDRTYTDLTYTGCTYTDRTYTDYTYSDCTYTDYTYTDCTYTDYTYTDCTQWKFLTSRIDRWRSQWNSKYFLIVNVNESEKLR
jgi:hypothetical protein